MGQGWDFGVTEELRRVEDEIRRNLRSAEPLLTEVASYVIGAGGKRLRPAVTLLAFRAVGGQDPEEAVQAATALELIHSATLLHDDINDGGLVRRGREAAYRKFGLQNALITGDFLFVKAFAIGGRFDEPVVSLTAEACTQLAEGEVRQKRRAGDVALRRDEYLDIITRKTAWPISVGARIGAHLGGGTPEQLAAVADYGLHLGIAFQIVDDVLDVIGDTQELGKNPGSDVREGNITLLAIHALNDGGSTRRELLDILQRREKEEQEVQRALRLIRDSGAVDAALEEARRFGASAKVSLSPLPAGRYRDRMVELVDFVLTRRS